jgi:hypothetical protein
MTVPILVTSLEPDSDFSEVCETLVVSAHGCAIRSSAKLDAGVPVQFQSKDGRWTMAHIVDCQPLDDSGWRLGARLDEPDNFWRLETCPEDWTNVLEMPSPGKPQRQSRSKATSSDLRAVVAELVEPLRAEIADLKGKLGQKQPKRSQLDISLTHIPPEVEEKIWIRLREDLGAQALQQTRQQSEQVLEAAKDAIGKKIREGQNEFRTHLAQELQTVGQRANALSEKIAESVQQHVQSGAERLQHQAVEAGIRQERKSEEFLRTLQQRLGEEHQGHLKEMQQVQAGVVSESSRLQAQNTSLATRIAKLDESARHLESDLDARLVRMGSDIISGARTQLEQALDVVLKELGTRNAKEINEQLEKACGQLKTLQKGIEASVSELLKARVTGTLLSFGQTMEELAQDSVGRWRSALGRDLGSLAKTLGEPLRLESSENSEAQDPAAD